MRQFFYADPHESDANLQHCPSCLDRLASWGSGSPSFPNWTRIHADLDAQLKDPRAKKGKELTEQPASSRGSSSWRPSSSPSWPPVSPSPPGSAPSPPSGPSGPPRNFKGAVSQIRRFFSNSF